MEYFAYRMHDATMTIIISHMLIIYFRTFNINIGLLYANSVTVWLLLCLNSTANNNNMTINIELIALKLYTKYIVCKYVQLIDTTVVLPTCIIINVQ